MVPARVIRGDCAERDETVMRLTRMIPRGLEVCMALICVVVVEWLALAGQGLGFRDAG